jgi:putative transposase
VDGRVRAFDNIFVERLWRSVKYEDIYLKGYAAMGRLAVGLTAYFAFYNEERPQQSLDHKTPNAVYQAASGGAMILEKYGDSSYFAGSCGSASIPVIRKYIEQQQTPN